MIYNSLYQFFGVWSYLIMAVIILIAFFIHEFAKVFIANVINPDAVTKGVPLKNFIEPIGFIFMFTSGIGWANSAKINPGYFKDRKRDTLRVYGGAIILSIIIGLALMILGNILQPTLLNPIKIGTNTFYISRVIYTLGVVNLAVGIMNMIPMIPFSGYHILFEISSPNTKMWLINNKGLVQMIVVFLMIFGIVTSAMNFIIYLFEILVSVFR